MRLLFCVEAIASANDSFCDCRGVVAHWFCTGESGVICHLTLCVIGIIVIPVATWVVIIITIIITPVIVVCEFVQIEFGVGCAEVPIEPVAIHVIVMYHGVE